MKKILSLISLLTLGFTLSACGTNDSNSKSSEEIDMTSYVDSLLLETPSYIPSWNRESFKGRWNYIDGVFLQSLLQVYKNTNDEKYKDFVIKYTNYYLDSNGHFLYLKEDYQNIYDSKGKVIGKELITHTPESNYGFTISEMLDTVCESKILFDLYNYTNDSRYTNAINYTYDRLLEQPRIDGTYNFYHKSRYVNTIYLDGMYMYVPFLAEYASKYNSDIFDEIVSQYKYIKDHMYDDATGLYYHGYESTKSIFWANPSTGCSKSFWSRSLGWYLMSLTDSIEYFPDGANKEYLKGLLDELLVNVLKYKNSKTNMFYQLTDKKNVSYNVSYDKYLKPLKSQYTKDTKIANYLESSGSSMISYSLMKSARLGYIDESYYEIGADIFEGIYKHSYDSKNKELKDICITAGLGPESSPHRDGTPEYYLAEPVGSNDAKGVGPFLMAYIEYKYN